MADLIDRQAAIDIVSGYAEQFNGYIGSPNDSEVYAYARGLLLSIERNINAVPSAQSEIIRCKDCKHNPKDSWFGCPMSHLSERQRPEDAWCWRAERRTDG